MPMMIDRKPRELRDVRTRWNTARRHGRRVGSCALFVVALFACALTACVDQMEADVSEGAHAQTADTHAVEVVFRGILPPAGIESYSVNGTDYELQLNGVWLVAGNMTVLTPGDPVPAYAPTSPFAPLAPGVHAAEGYTAADLTAESVVAAVDVPAGRAGPVYVSVTPADGPVSPVNADDVPSIDAHTLVFDGTISVGDTTMREVRLIVDTERVVIFGAPAFDVSGSTTLVYEVDLRGWFDGIDPNTLQHSSNVIEISETSNTDAWTTLSDRALSALDEATLSVE